MVACAVILNVRSRNSLPKPFITESTTMSDITPTITLSTEITVITGMNACFRLSTTRFCRGSSRTPGERGVLGIPCWRCASGTGGIPSLPWGSGARWRSATAAFAGSPRVASRCGIPRAPETSFTGPLQRGSTTGWRCCRHSGSRLGPRRSDARLSVGSGGS